MTLRSDANGLRVPSISIFEDAHILKEDSVTIKINF